MNHTQKKKQKEDMKFRFVDLFCGGGGSITGAINALQGAGRDYDGRGFNHWDIAIRTIQANHPEIVPDFKRACAPIESILPDEIFADDPTRLDVLWASPSCTHHSVAAGGKPKSNQLRSQPEYLLPYLRLTKCRRMFVENVKELRDWGPLLDNDTVFQGKRYKAGQPDPRRKGLFFNLWYREVKASGYKVDMQVLNAADYGAATSRERLIIQAVRESSGEKIVWPEQTHSNVPGLFGYKPWRTAAEIIDWSIPSESIFNRKKPLCENTLKRIEAGIERYWGAWAEPFLVVLRGTKPGQLLGTAVPLSHPLPTLTAGGGGHVMLIRPLFVPQQSAGAVKPGCLPTIATAGAIGLVEPFLTEYHGTGGPVPIGAPCPTILTKDHFGLVQGRVLVMPDGRQFRLDITHRMLSMRELADATSFPHDYMFCGGDTAAKKQIGNAVPPALAEALYRAVLAA